MRKFHECNYCEFEKTVPDTYITEYLDKLVDKYTTRKSERALTLIEILVKTSWKAEIVVSEYHPHINQIILNKPCPYFSLTDQSVQASLIKRFYSMNPSTKSFGLTKCFSCDKYTCEFHETHGGFEHYKCEKCSTYVSICGWCAEYSLCFQMIRTKLCKKCQQIKNKEKKAKSEEMIIKLFNLDGNIEECKTYISLDKLEDEFDEI